MNTNNTQVSEKAEDAELIKKTLAYTDKISKKNRFLLITTAFLLIRAENRLKNLANNVMPKVNCSVLAICIYLTPVFILVTHN